VPKKVETLPDTNAVLRYLLQDVPDQSRAASAFFERVRSGDERAIVLESVLVECIYVLLKHYRVPKAELTDSLIGLLRYRGMAGKDRRVLIAALRLYAENNLDPVDCMLLARAAEGRFPILSFDKAVNRFASHSNSRHASQP
jgi:predicted nucleic-acid-binding protein